MVCRGGSCGDSMTCISCGRDIDQLDILGPYCYMCLVTGTLDSYNRMVVNTYKGGPRYEEYLKYLKGGDV